MYCPECGMQFPDDASFCPRCGRYVSFQGNTYTESVYGTTTSDYAAESSYNVRPKRNYGTLIAAILIAVVVIAVIFFPFSAEKPELDGRTFSHAYESTYAATDHKITYTWEYLGGDFSFDIPISQAAYSYYSTLNPYARTMLYSDCIDYVEDTYLVADKVLATLKVLYKEAFGTDPVADQKYADFILAYVQGAFAYALDLSQYGQEEYFAYPVETLYSKKGDCEDTSVLCAMLYKLAGFRTAILIVPEHAMVGVALSEYSEPNLDGGEILKAISNGLTYYAGETTVDSFQPVGLSYGKYHNKFYSQLIYTAKVGQYPEYIFYEVDP